MHVPLTSNISINLSLSSFNFDLQNMATLFSPFVLIVLQLFAISSIPHATSQRQPPTTDNCNGILISYIYQTGNAIPPILVPANSTDQPYRFQSFLTVLNGGLEDIKSWQVFVGFQHRELLVSASGAVLADGTSLPADVSNGTILAGSPVTDLKSAVDTAGDWNQMQAQVQLVGTQFGIGAPAIPLPSNLSLVNHGFLCSTPVQGNSIHETRVCCLKDSKSIENNSTLEEDFLPRQSGDLTIMYDVTSTYDTNYWAQVTISNNNPNSHLVNWQLSWEWMRDEFIFAMKGAYPDVVDTTRCVFGPQGVHYKDMDFSTALNCERRPTIVDLPVTRTNDTTFGMIPLCCRNGTILPPSMDPSRSKSAFVMQVYKMSPDLNRTRLTPPQNWRINGTVSPAYQCGPPVPVNPSTFPDSNGLSSDRTAVASWQVVCNITKSKFDVPKCCVSFSSFFNDSVVPCNTCACGCKSNPSNVCNATAPALLLPAEALLVPFENRTKKALNFADLHKQEVPNPLPCGDNCGVSINWHLLTDYKDGWTARMTIFNWGDTDFADWFAAVELDHAMAGLEAVYSFNGSTLPNANNTLFLHGFDGLNYLVAEKNGSNPKKDPPVPGTLQSVMMFTKKKTPGIRVVRGDGFPSKVYFNGEECSLPTALPISNGRRVGAGAATTISSFLLVILMSLQPQLWGVAL